VRVPFPEKALSVLEGVLGEVDAVAAGFWTNNMHDHGPFVLSQVVPGFAPVHVVLPVFVPGAHNETVPLAMVTWA
jgi:hypothetical protein